MADRYKTLDKTQESHNVITFKLTDDELSELDERILKAGYRNRSKYIRELIFNKGAVGVGFSPKIQSDTYTSAASAAILAIGRVGTNINQAVHRINYLTLLASKKGDGKIPPYISVLLDRISIDMKTLISICSRIRDVEENKHRMSYEDFTVHRDSSEEDDIFDFGDDIRDDR